MTAVSRLRTLAVSLRFPTGPVPTADRIAAVLNACADLAEQAEPIAGLREELAELEKACERL